MTEHPRIEVFLSLPGDEWSIRNEGLRERQQAQAVVPRTALERMHEFCAGTDVLVAHNGTTADFPMLDEACEREDLPPFPGDRVDSLYLAHCIWPLARSHRLAALGDAYGVNRSGLRWHDAADDADTQATDRSLAAFFPDVPFNPAARDRPDHLCGWGCDRNGQPVAAPRRVTPALPDTNRRLGIVYYAFPALLARITVDTGWSSGATTGAFSLTLLVSAAGVPISHILDRRGPHLVRAGGSALAVVGMLTVAFAPNPLLFCAAWAVRQAKGAAR